MAGEKKKRRTCTVDFTSDNDGKRHETAVYVMITTVPDMTAVVKRSEV